MPDEHQIEEALTAPLGALEDLIRTPAEALRQGVQRLNQSAQSGLPKVPEPPESPRLEAISTRISTPSRESEN